MKLYKLLNATLTALFLLALTSRSEAFNFPGCSSDARPSLRNGVMSRGRWLETTGGACVGILLGSPPAAFAKEDSDLKGTKKDPAFEGCLSTCMYECTKPKGMEQKSRGECLPECKAKCATTKAQLMKGTPLQK